MNASRPPALLLLDFDGTIATEDVGNLICERFASPDWKRIEAQYIAGDMSIDTAQREMWSTVRATEQAVSQLIAQVPLRSGFQRLMTRAKCRQIPVYILSGGFEWYIRRMLGDSLQAVDGIFSNRLRFLDDMRVVPEFPSRGQFGCHRCAICKARVVEHLRGLYPTGTPVIFAGDGASDRCAVDSVDVLYAIEGSSLAAYCQRIATPVRTLLSFDTVHLEEPVERFI